MKIFENSRIQSSRGRNVIILLGGPGAGKGTQAEAIHEWLKVPHISSGHLLRSEVAAASPLGLQVKTIVDAGGLVGDDIVDELILGRIRNQDCSSGFILEGYPRNVGQAVALEGNLSMWDRQIVIDLLTDLDEMVARLKYRHTCKVCGAIYNSVAAPPDRPGVCDYCNNSLVQRSDDNEQVIRERFKVYRAMNDRLRKLYTRMGVYHAIDGMRPEEQIARDIRQLLEREIFELSIAGRIAAD
jgi:adenylate kinase